MVRRLLRNCWVQKKALLSRTFCRLRGCGKDELQSDCETVNIGCLSRGFPHLHDPEDSNDSDTRSVCEILATIEGISRLRDVSSLSPDFLRKHKYCDVGRSIKPQTDDLLDKIHGLKLEAMDASLTPPPWLGCHIADLEERYPGVRSEGLMQEVTASTFTSRPVKRYLGRDISPDPDTNRIQLPWIKCLDVQNIVTAHST